MKYPILPRQKAFLFGETETNYSFEKAKAVIIPFGLEQSVSYKGGTKDGPKAMIEASAKLEMFDEEFWCEPHKKIGVVTLEEPKIKKDLNSAINQLEEITNWVLSQNKFPFIFGGEHSITAGSIKPFAKKYQDLTILHFDAHADLRDGYLGEHYSHAAALRRCLDFENISLVSCGIRSISSEEIPFLESNQNRIKIFWAKDKKNWNIQEIIKTLKGKPVYLTFDIDGLDPSIMPATGTPEPGGLFWDEAIEIIREASKICNIVGADINELSPMKGFHSCDFLAAKLAYKILSFAFLRK